MNTAIARLSVRWQVFKNKSSSTMFVIEGFFDNYPRFYITSRTSAFSNRLNTRYLALIENNKDIIKGKRILDVASHDGRWSFAALKNEAKHVLGIEGRQQLVDNAKKTFEQYEIPRSSFDFICGDVHKELMKIESGTIDVVFCFGFFYHTLNHMQILSEIKRLNSRYLIIDTSISTSDKPVIEIREESTDDEANAIRTTNNYSLALVGYPSKSAIEMMLRHMEFDFSYYDWQNKTSNSKDLEDYQRNLRISMVASRQNV